MNGTYKSRRKCILHVVQCPFKYMQIRNQEHSTILANYFLSKISGYVSFVVSFQFDRSNSKIVLNVKNVFQFLISINSNNNDSNINASTGGKDVYKAIAKGESVAKEKNVNV